MTTLLGMSAHPKLTTQRQERLIAILGLGESLEAACRAVQVSGTAVRKCADRDPLFAARLKSARTRDPGSDAPDWIAAAATLEIEYPERWGALTAWDD